jgi:hypothetical protein
MILREVPRRWRGAKVMASDIGMLTPMMAVVLTSRQEEVEHSDRQEAAEHERCCGPR